MRFITVAIYNSCDFKNYYNNFYLVIIMGIQPRKKVIEQMDNFIQKLPKGDRELLEAMVEEEVLTFEKLLREPNRLLENRDENDGRRVDANFKKKIHKKLHDIYYKQGYNVSRDQLWKLIKEQAPQLNTGRDQVEDWLNNQELHQLYKMPRKSKGVNNFTPIKPFRALSTDLIDFTNKQHKQYRYILTVMDNFSRYLWSEALTDKTEEKVGAGLDRIFTRINKDFGNPDFGYIISDRGGEFKKDAVQVFKKYRLNKVTTIAGAPQSNGLIERSNGVIKRIMKKYIEINGGGWSDVLKKVIKIYNNLPNRSTDMKPIDAVKGGDDVIKKLKESVKETQDDEGRTPPKVYKVGDTVRVKIPKGVLDKYSDKNWSSTLHKIIKVIPAAKNRAAKYKVSGRQDDELFVRQDLQVINDPDGLEKIPSKAKAIAKAKEERAVKRSDTKKPEPRRSVRITK